MNIINAAGTIVLGAAAFGTDTPVVPVETSLIELSISGGLLDEVCASYSALIPVFTVELGGDIELARDVADSYVIVTLETGLEDGNGRLTAEARDLLTDHLHTC